MLGVTGHLFIHRFHRALSPLGFSASYSSVRERRKSLAGRRLSEQDELQTSLAPSVTCESLCDVALVKQLTLLVFSADGIV